MGTGLGVQHPPALKFYEDIRSQYGDNIMLTGHSLGGHVAQAVAVTYNVAKTIVYNSAPLYPDSANINGLGNVKNIDEKIARFTGTVIRFRTADDPLNLVMDSNLLDGVYLGEEHLIPHLKLPHGHGMSNFLNGDVYEQVYEKLEKHFGKERVNEVSMSEQVFKDSIWNFQDKGKSSQSVQEKIESILKAKGKRQEHSNTGTPEIDVKEVLKKINNRKKVNLNPFTILKDIGEGFWGGVRDNVTTFFNGLIGNDKLKGTEKNDDLLGKNGNDTLSGLEGNDRLDGGEGNDSLYGGKGNDQLLGRSGNDTLEGGKGTDELIGDKGNDILKGEEGSDRLFGDDGKDLLQGGDGDDILDGGKDSDELIGGEGDDVYVFYKDSGKDSLVDNQGANILYFGKGIRFENMSVTRSYENYVTLKYSKKDEIKLNNFTHYMDAPDDSAYKGSEYRNFFLVLEDGKVIHAEDAESPFRFVTGTDESDHLFPALKSSSIKAGGGNDSLTGSSGDDVLEGQDGHDEIKAEKGNDLLNGGYGNDKLYGGYGDDTYQFGRDFGFDTISDSEGKNTIEFVGDILPTHVYVSKTDSSADLTLSILDSQDRVKITGFRHYDINKNFNLKFTDGTVMTLRDARSPLRRVVGSSEGDTLNVSMSGMESILFGLSGNDTLNGSTGADTLNGGADNDTLKGDKGNDTLEGGVGNDSLSGGADDDIYLFQKGHGIDRVLDSEGVNRLKFTDHTKSSDYKLYRHNAWDIKLKNNETGDEIQLNGFLIDNPIYRNVVLEFSDGTEMRPEDEGSLFKTIHGKKENDYLSAIYENSTLLGYEGNDSLNGSSGNDVLRGGKGDDLLNAGRGNDILDGGIGNDRLEGDFGDDTYLFNLGDGQDRVFDTVGQNILHFGEKILPEHLKLTKVNNDLNIDYHETDRVTLSSYFYSSTYQNFSLAFANKQTATINAESLTLNITPAPVEEKIEEVPVSETVLTPEVTATQVAPTEMPKTETVIPAEGEVAVQSVSVESSNTTTETVSDTVVVVEDVTKSSDDALGIYPTVNTGETMAYIAQPLPDVTNQVVGQ